jgi:hypothetical protein
MMRVLLWSCLSVALFGLPALADDALVLPRGAWRIYLVPTWTKVDAVYGASGDLQEIPAGLGRVKSFNLGYALEYGINSWLATGVQWTPGTTLSSSFDYLSGDPMRRDKAQLNDAFDAKLGFKLQVIGSTVKDPQRATGLTQSDSLRLAFALGVKAPLTTIDWEREKSSFTGGKTYVAQAADKHLVAPIVGLYADYVLVRAARRELFVNLYSEYIPYLSHGKYNATSLVRYLDRQLADARIDYGYDFLVEVEPRLDIWVAARALRMGIYLPVRYKVTPSTQLDGIDQHNSGCRATIFPTLDLFALAPGLPVELKIGYYRSLAGKNAAQARSWMVMVRVIVLRPKG